MVPVLLLARELNFGGIERDVSNYARHLSLAGIEAHVACFRTGGARWDQIVAAGIPTLEIPLRSFRSPAVFSAAHLFARYLQRHSIKVVHAFDPTTSLWSVPWARLFGVPVVISSTLTHRSFNPLWTRVALRPVDGLSSAVMVNCEALKVHLVTDYGLRPERVWVCPNGVETSTFQPLNRTRLAAVNAASLVVGSVCVLRPEKDVITLLRAFALLRHSVPAAMLLIVGDGPMLPTLLAESVRLDLGSSCIFHPAMVDAAVAMRSIDVFVSSSLSEGLSNALLEAMACGCCPIGSRAGGTPEAIPQGCGLLFEAGNVEDLAAKLHTVMLSNAERERFSQNAQDHVAQQHRMEVATQRLGTMYRQLLSATQTYRHT